MQYEEVNFVKQGRVLAGKRWHAGGLPTFALHGWLDNANSFDWLAPRLPELDLLALDFAGHGRSDHRHAEVPYRGDFDIEDVLHVADRLGWERFNVIGHSMGAEYGSQMAGLVPDRVVRLVCIDGFADSVTGAQAVDARRQAIERGLSPGSGTPRVFASLDAMARRVEEATRQRHASVMTLVERGHRVVPGGLTWATDPRLRHDGMQLVAAEELEELVRRTKAPTLILDAMDGQHWFRKSVARIEAVHPSLKVVPLPGSHHLHMEEASAPAVLEEIRTFLQLP